MVANAYNATASNQNNITPIKNAPIENRSSPHRRYRDALTLKKHILILGDSIPRRIKPSKIAQHLPNTYVTTKCFPGKTSGHVKPTPR